ncbi:zinc-ribbon domain-containing protein [Marinicaulis aureus]|uniref:Zinc-ribbon domain-containing protein n=1 Tax=Hyphococcus aureus TaxID=2666033 RepID=A0ABW1KVL5_9PROT
MIITCPECTTRYDVDDERFSPNGRSVRCSSCGESWFVPAPELLDMEPLDKPVAKKAAKRAADQDDDDKDIEDEKASARAKRRVEAAEDDQEDGDEDEDSRAARPRMKVGIADDEPEEDDDRTSAKRAKTIKSAKRDWREEEEERETKSASKRSRSARRLAEEDEDDDDDSLFTSPASRKGRDQEDDDDAPAGKGWRKGRQFIVEEDEEDDRRPLFSRKRKEKPEERESLRFADDDAEEDEQDQYNAAYVVDADWEDVDEDGGERTRGFGRKIRAERRRATALARMEDVRPLNPEDLDEEFFAALRVTPRELERAIRKARRRAESREKNRLTPLRVVGWTAWLGVVAAVVYGVLVYRDEIVKVAPKTADAYAVIGIEANPYGLAIENVRHRLAMSTNGPTIEITGNLRNESDGLVAAPLLQAEALGSRGELLARWTFSANQSDVAEGEMVDFITRAPAPEGVAEVALSFAPEKSVLESLIPGKGE